MKKTLIAMITAIVAMPAIAADVPFPPRRTADPIFTQAEATKDWYVGFRAGATAGDRTRFTLEDGRAVAGAAIGYEINPWLRVEADLTNRFGAGRGGQMLTGNAIGQHTIQGTNFTPYVLAGVGAGWNQYGDAKGNAASLWNVGGGVRYAINKTWELDARYRYVQQFERQAPGADKRNESLITTGVNYRF